VPADLDSADLLPLEHPAADHPHDDPLPRSRYSASTIVAPSTPSMPSTPVPVGPEPPAADRPSTSGAGGPGGDRPRVWGPPQHVAAVPLPLGDLDAGGPDGSSDLRGVPPVCGPQTGEVDPALAAVPWSLLVRVLGRPEVVGPDLAPVRFEKAKALELVVWLAEHAAHPSRSGARAALWELDVRDATFANVVSEARRALTRTLEPPDRIEWVGRGQGDRLPLHPAVRTDVDVLRETARRCRDLPDAVAVPALRGALALVRDTPYAGSAFLWPDAEGRTSAAILVATAAAADLAARCLDLGDVDGAFWATGQGLLALPGHEELVCLRMEAHAHRGDLAGVRAEYAAYERVVLADPWGDGTIAAKVAAARSRFLTRPVDAAAS
jgi:hypothetical protein